jgi:translation initiation factor IF-3
MKQATNEEIRSSLVFLIDQNGKKIGSTTIEAALQKAKNEGYDLVQVNDDTLPICKLINMEKFQYKKAKSLKKQSKQKLKELRFNLVTGEHDIQTKMKQANKFLRKGDIVKIAIRVKGRQSNKDGIELMENLLKKIEEPFAIQNPIKVDKNRSVMTIIVPSKKK